MNFPINLLFDIELAKSRLQEAFKPADDRKTQPVRRQMERSRTETPEGSVPPRFRLPEVRGCAGVSFQAL
jgi:hypothetical protein